MRRFIPRSPVHGPLLAATLATLALPLAVTGQAADLRHRLEVVTPAPASPEVWQPAGTLRAEPRTRRVEGAIIGAATFVLATHLVLYGGGARGLCSRERSQAALRPQECSLITLGAGVIGAGAGYLAGSRLRVGSRPAHAAPADDLEALFRARLAADRLRFTAADVRFMTDMIVHHGQAVTMSRWTTERDVGPAVRTLAARITTGQLDEIALMQRWLRERGQPVPDPFADHAHHAQHGMPGMLTAAQLAELERARGTDFDRLFLTLMIEHHRGAVVMVDTLLASDGAAQDPAVFRLAAGIHAEQTAEIARMQRLLVTLLGGRGTP